MAGYAPGEQPREAGFIKLNTNENPYPPSPRVAAALREAAADDLRLYPDPLCSALRDRIAAIHGCRPSQVMVGNGSDELLALAIRSLVPRSMAVGWFEPSYSLYPVLASMEELEARPAELGPEFGWTDPDTDGVGLFFVTHPNAPTGMVQPGDRLRAFCQRFDGVVVIDEAYADFAPDNFMDLGCSSDRVLVLRSLSKSYSLAGLRCGYAVGPDVLIGAMRKIKDSYNVDRLAQSLALAALSDPAWMRANVARIVATRERARSALEGMGCRVYPSAANFLWFRPAGADAEAVAAALRNRRILVRHFRGRRTAEFLRVTVGTDDEMGAFLAAMSAILG